MKIRVILASKFRDKNYENIVGEYIKRISGFGEVQLIQLPESRSGDSENTMAARAVEKILKQAEGYYLISLDLTGKQRTSECFASWLKNRSEIHKKLAFLIGPSGGLSKSLTEKSNELISLSKLTFAHKITALVLFEQIYRAICINTNHPYHK
ncbi:23S rRNA (pseudouridine(1915)-N(3))-methyltransferase RlmH [Flexistipes sinusarabici]|nr:23S rRNA (pseudouridine(1915)-N(3))-methyltransferase RlmH [Flexistipes sinusarabici]